MTDQTPIQRARAMPALLQSTRISYAALSADLPPQQFLDGLMIPRGVATIFAMSGGKGKSTALLRTALVAAARGDFELFGMRQTGRPLRVAMIMGEENAARTNVKIQHELGLRDVLAAAEQQGTLALISWTDYMRTMPGQREKVFGKDGALTKPGAEIFTALRDWKPDLIILDTQTSLSSCEYNSDAECYETIGALNELAEDTGAAVIMTAHLTKEGQRKKEAGVPSPDELIAANRGSAAFINASRHAIVMTEAPDDAWPNIQRGRDDVTFVAAVKTNLDCRMAGASFPVVRSREMRTFLAVADYDNTPLGERARVVDDAMVELLEKYAFGTILYAARSLQPFAESGKMSIGGLYDDLLAPILPAGATRRQVETAVANLIRDQRVRVARSSATSTPVLDVEDGPFANPELHLHPETGKPPAFRKGAPDITALRDRIESYVRTGHAV